VVVSDLASWILQQRREQLHYICPVFLELVCGPVAANDDVLRHVDPVCCSRFDCEAADNLVSFARDSSSGALAVGLWRNVRERRIVGRDALNAKIERILQEAPGFVFRATAPAQLNHDLGRLQWHFGPAGAPPVVTGMDVAVFEHGRIRALYTFLDKPSSD
jgi:hypothetical protein